jgi:hypothetical protein
MGRFPGTPTNWCPGNSPPLVTWAEIRKRIKLKQKKSSQRKTLLYPIRLKINLKVKKRKKSK